MDPMTMAALASAAGSLFNKKPSYDPNQRRMMEIAQQLQRYAGGVPGSSPDEQAALAQMRGQLGAEQGQATNAILGALPGGARTNVADLMQNLAGSQASERANLDLQQIMESLNRRRQALTTSAQVYGSVGPKGGGYQSNLPEMIGQLAYQQAMAKAMKTRQPGTNDPRFQPGGSIWPPAPLHAEWNPAANVGTALAGGAPATSPKPVFGQSAMNLGGVFGGMPAAPQAPPMPSGFFGRLAAAGRMGAQNPVQDWGMNTINQPPSGGLDWATDRLSRRLRGG